MPEVTELKAARKLHLEQGKRLRQLEAAAGITSADKKRQAMAIRSRELSVQVAEIGQPPPRSERLYKRYKNNLFLFLTENFPQTIGLSPLSEDHRRIIDRLQQTILDGGQELIIMPRGFAKSTILELTAIWATGYGHRQFFVLLAATDEMASLALDSIKYEFTTNDRLMKVFPAACYAARALEGVAQRSGKQTIGGELTRIEWNSERIVLPTVKGFAGSGAIIWPRSIVAKGLRGMRFKRPDGQQARPDYVLADDLQTAESAISPSQTKKRMDILTKDVLLLGGHRVKLAIVIVGTVVAPDDLLDQLCDRKRFRSWRAMKVPMLKSLPTNLKEWQTTYADIRGNYDPNDDDDRERAEQEANAHYLANREMYDAGAVASWESCFVQGHELSAIQHAMNIFVEGEEAFYSECQSAPLLMKSGSLPILTPSQMAERQSPYERSIVATNATVVTAFVDIGHHVFDIEVWCWEPDGTGYQVNSFSYPDQKRKYYDHRQPPHPLDDVFPSLDAESTVGAGLSALINGNAKQPGLMEQVWQTPEGKPFRISCALVDANGEFRDRIVRVLSQSKFSASIHPSFGKGIGAKHAPISAWPNARKQRHGGEWVFTQGKPGEILGIQFDTNFYKTRLHRGLVQPEGSQGALYLFKGNPADKRLECESYNSELPHEVNVGSRTVQEFTLKPNAHNHRLDAAVGNLVAASRCGIGNQPTQRPVAKKKKRTTYYAA